MDPDTEYHGDQPMCESPGPSSMMTGRPRRRDIGAGRRRELLSLAADLADQVEMATAPHERCLLRHMVEMMVDSQG